MRYYQEIVWCCTTGKGSQLCVVDKKHDELKSFGRFWYQEIRDFLIRRHTGYIYGAKNTGQDIRKLAPTANRQKM
jgi:hypothetical protein